MKSVIWKVYTLGRMNEYKLLGYIRAPYTQTPYGTCTIKHHLNLCFDIVPDTIQNHDFVKPMYKVRARVPGGKTRTFWAIKLKETTEHVLYRRLTRYGELTDNLILGTSDDIIKEQLAELDKHYGRMKLKGATL